MITEPLTQMRKKLLAQLNSSDFVLENFRAELNKAKQRFSSLFQPDSGDAGLVHDRMDWTAAYFSKQKLRAEHNFSRERLEHLLEVRSHLYELGVQGFVPSGSSQSSLSKIQDGSTADMASTFEPSNNLKEAVEGGDLELIRIMLNLELNNNRLTSADLRAAVEWTEAEVYGLFEAYSEGESAREMTDDSAKWSSKYYDLQDVYLTTNYSKERLLHRIAVRDFLREQRADGFAPLPPRKASNPKPIQENRRVEVVSPFRDSVGRKVEWAGEKIRDTGRKIRGCHLANKRES